MKKTILIGLLAVVAFLSIGYYLKQHKEKEEAQEVYNEVKQGLLLLSKEYNKGIEKASYLQQYEEAKHKIVKEPK